MLKWALANAFLAGLGLAIGIDYLSRQEWGWAAFEFCLVALNGLVAVLCSREPAGPATASQK